MKYVFGCVTVLIVGCQYSPVAECVGEEFAAADMRICNEGGKIDTRVLENLVILTEIEVSQYYPEVNDFPGWLKIWDVSINYIDGSLSVGCAQMESGVWRCDGHAGGATSWVDDKKIIIDLVSDSTCAGSYALPHELLHVVEIIYWGDINTDHDRPNFFIEEYRRQPSPKFASDVENYVEWQTTNQYMEMCEQ